MSIEKVYRLYCTSCRSSFHDEGQWYFETAEDAKNRGKKAGWRIDEEVPNGTKWDFCPKCLKRMDEVDYI